MILWTLTLLTIIIVWYTTRDTSDSLSVCGFLSAVLFIFCSLFICVVEMDTCWKKTNSGLPATASYVNHEIPEIQRQAKILYKEHNAIYIYQELAFDRYELNMLEYDKKVVLAKLVDADTSKVEKPQLDSNSYKPSEQRLRFVSWWYMLIYSILAIGFVHCKIYDRIQNKRYEKRVHRLESRRS